MIEPSNCRAFPQGFSSILVQWTPGYQSGDPGNVIKANVYYRLQYAGAWILWAVFYGNQGTSLVSGLRDGSAYDFYVGNSVGDSNAITAITFLPAPNGLHGRAISDTEINIYWNDNSQYEIGFEVYMDGVYHSTTAANATTAYISGLGVVTYHTFRVRAVSANIGSDLSSEVRILTGTPPASPTGLTATATGTTKARLNWIDNANNETSYEVWQSPDGSTAWAKIATLGINVQTYEVTSGLVSNTEYWWKVLAANDSGDSGDSNIATTSTWAAIAKPTNVKITPWLAGTLEITFDDNSELETDHRLEQSSNGTTGWTQIAESAPNQTFIRVAGLGNGTLRYFRIRARQVGSPDSYSSYSDVVSGTTLSLPTSPYGLVLSEIQDVYLHVTWTPGAADEAGFIIETSPNNSAWTEIGRSCKGSTNYKIRNLTASTLVYVRVCSFNAVGSSAYATAVSTTTLAKYSPSSFERACRRLTGKLRYYAELQPAMRLSGWTISSGKTYTYETMIIEKRINFDGVEENGVTLTLKTSIATVEAAAGSWWYDTAARKMYVRSLGGLAPLNYSYIGTFWAYFSNWNKAGEIAEFNGNHYLPLIADGGIPDISMGISQIWQGSFSLSSGSIKFINGYRKTWGGYFFDQRAENWIFENRPARILAGAPGATYDQLGIIHTATMGKPIWSLANFEIPLGDIRSGRAISLPVDKYSISDFPNMDANLKDQFRPFWYGSVTGIIPKCLDTVNRVFEFQNGRYKSQDALRQNGLTLTVDVDYFVDYQRGRVTLARDLSYLSSDVIDGDITGHVDDADSSLDHGALQFIDFNIRYVGLSVSDLDLDSVYETHDALTAHLGWGAYKGVQDSQEFIHLIERSCYAYSVQDSQGRIGLRRKAATAPSGVVYIKNGHINGPSSGGDLSIYAAQVLINYAEDPGNSGRFQYVVKNIPGTIWDRKIQSLITLNTAHITKAGASALGDEIVADLGKTPFIFTVPSIGWRLMPCDAFYLSMARFPNSFGLAAAQLMRVLSVSKSTANRSTTITAEDV